MEQQMERLEQDLRFFKHELERERNAFRRNLLLQLIAYTEQRILDLLIEERTRLDRENRNMEIALSIIQKREQDKKK